MSRQTITCADEIIAWYDGSLNWDNPPEPVPWSQAQVEQFNHAVGELFQAVQQELGDEFEIINEERGL